MMHKKLLFVIAISTVVLLLISRSIYDQKYAPENIEFHYSYFTSCADSPNGKYSVGVYVRKEEQDSIYAYIEALCYEVDKNMEKNYEPTTILWDKVESNSIMETEENKTTLTPSFPKMEMFVYWRDNETVEINGRLINIHKGYDYRRSN